MKISFEFGRKSVGTGNFNLLNSVLDEEATVSGFLLESWRSTLNENKVI